MEKEIYVIGVVHQMFGPKRSLAHPIISKEIFKKNNEIFQRDKSLIIAEDFSIPKTLHHCKCGRCLVCEDVKSNVVKIIFGVHKDIKSDIVIADTRDRPNSAFIAYQKIVSAMLEQGGMIVNDVDAYCDFIYKQTRKKYKSQQILNGNADYTILLKKGILKINKEIIEDHLKDYLKHGLDAHRLFLHNSLLQECDDSLLSALRYHRKRKKFDTIILIAGAAHTENIVPRIRIKKEYENYMYYSFEPWKESHEFMSNYFHTQDKYKLLAPFFFGAQSFIWNTL